MCIPVPTKKRRRHRGFGVTAACKLPNGCWKLNASSLDEQQELLEAQLSLLLLGFGGKEPYSVTNSLEEVANLYPIHNTA